MWRWSWPSTPAARKSRRRPKAKRRSKPHPFRPAGPGPERRHIAKMAELRLIVGLGNPVRHANTRQRRVSFAGLPCGGKGRRASGWSPKLFGETARADIGGRSVWLLKPSTWMNLSGKSVAAALRYWKIEPEQALLVHDELDLPPRRGSSSTAAMAARTACATPSSTWGTAGSTACGSASAIPGTRTGSLAGCSAAPARTTRCRSTVPSTRPSTRCRWRWPASSTRL